MTGPFCNPPFTPSTTPPPPSLEAQADHYTILIVEDSETILWLYEMYCTTHHPTWTLVLAANLAEAEKAIKKYGGAISLVISDGWIGGGKNVADVMRAMMMSNLTCPLILVTANVHNFPENALPLLPRAVFQKGAKNSDLPSIFKKAGELMQDSHT